jgi:peptidoglycan/LPS O-acetylase OafA/YrhL
MRVVSLDALRGVAALTVAVPHYLVAHDVPGTHWLWCGPCGIIFIAAFFALKLVGAALVPDWDAVARRLVLFRLDAIAFGFLLYFLITKVPSFTSRGAVPLHFAFLVMASVAMAVTMAIISSHENTTIRLIFFYLSPLFGGSLIAILYATNNAFLKLRIVERLSTFFGSISYDVYLFHLPVMLVLDRILAPSVGMFVFYISGVLVVSCLMRLMIENRILAARPGYARFTGTGFLGPSAQIEESRRSSQSASEVG